MQLENNERVVVSFPKRLHVVLQSKNCINFQFTLFFNGHFLPMRIMNKISCLPFTCTLRIPKFAVNLIKLGRNGYAFNYFTRIIYAIPCIDINCYYRAFFKSFL